jgi:hypothetical protein
MTIIGKILTFLIFVFSLLFLGFAIIINQTNKDPRTKKSWYTVAMELKDGEKNYLSDLTAKDAELTALRSQIVTMRTEQANMQTRFDERVKELENKVSIAENAQKTATDRFQQSQVVIGQLQTDIENKTRENLAMSERQKTKDTEINGLRQQVTTERNQRTTAQIESATLRERLTASEKLVAEQSRQINDLQESAARVTTTAAGDAPRQVPPPSDVQGTVSAVRGDYISINKGSDQGLAKGHTLEVYRMSPKAEWVGRMRLVEVNNHEAVGIIIVPANRKVTVNKGDLVGSSILPTYQSR